MQQEHIDKIIKEHGQLRLYTAYQCDFLMQQTQDMNELKKLFQQIQSFMLGLSVPRQLMSTVWPPTTLQVIFDDVFTGQPLGSVYD